MMKNLLIFTAFMAFNYYAAAQSAGDYKSVSGTELAWEDNTNWEIWSDVLSDWEPAVDYPANDGTPIDYTITIPTGSDVIYGMVSLFNLNIGGTGQLVVESGGVLCMLFRELNIAAGAAVTVDGELNCEENIDNAGDLTVNGSLRNFIP